MNGCNIHNIDQLLHLQYICNINIFTKPFIIIQGLIVILSDQCTLIVRPMNMKPAFYQCSDLTVRLLGINTTVLAALALF
jgi:hypothetical protein